MGAVPKRRTSKGRKNRRRAHHALVPKALIPCPYCKKLKQPYHICPFCGKYKDKEMIKVKK